MEHTNLFLYETEEDFLVDYPEGKMDQPVPGVAYIRGEAGELGTLHVNRDITTYEITIHSTDKSGVTVAEDYTVETPAVLEGNSAKVKIVAPEIEGYTPTVESVKIEVSEDTEYTFVYRNAAVNEPLTFNILSNGEIFWYCNDTSNTRTIEYKKNDGEWTSITSENEPGASIGVVSGDVVQFRGDNSAYATDSYSNAFGSDCEFSVAGNIMSLINSTGFSEITTLTEDYTFSGLFSRRSGLISAENLLLPATTLSEGCYNFMFAGCTSLTAAPELPATTLADYCYGSMFTSCESLTNAPSLPATNLANYCYESMFRECSSLTTAPELPATTLAESCYSSMFSGCASLTTAPDLPATTLAEGCYDNMFSNCTGLTMAPELPATTLADYCYTGMCNGCTSLSFIKCLATDISADYCTDDWLAGVAPTGIFIMNPNATDWEIGESGIPTGWITGDTEDTFITGDEITLFESGGSKSAIVYSTANPWTASTVDSWITLGANTGDTGLTNLTITAQATTSGRTGSVTITDGETTKTLNVIQDNKAVFLRQPLTLNIISGSNGRIWWLRDNRADSKEIRYKKNDEGWWNSMTSSTGSYASSIYVNAGDKIEIVGDNDAYGESWNGGIGSYFSASTGVRFSVEGNVMSLINSSNYAQLSAFTADYTFVKLFNACTALTSTENLMLPVTTLANYCYQGMFQGCTSLTSAPELPATTLADYCYYYMFSGCTSLTTAPELPATTLASGCYYGMFWGCTSITTAPEIPVETLAERCYYGMFQGCTSLTTAPELPATTLADGCYSEMFNGCTSLTTAPELPATTLASWCYSNMFYGCTSLATAPELPATGLTIHCYANMFNRCTSLTTAPELPAAKLTSYCYLNMFSGCSSLNYIKCLATDVSSATSPINGWVAGVASTGTFVKNPNMSSWTTGNNGIPYNWTVEDAS